jgi:hypothetical protein
MSGIEEIGANVFRQEAAELVRGELGYDLHLKRHRSRFIMLKK